MKELNLIVVALSLLAASLSPAPSSVDDAGVIAYIELPSGDIHLISPDGTNDRVLWPNPSADVAPIYLAWRPDGGELAFSSQHENKCSFFDSDVYAIRSDGTSYRRVTNAPACAGLAALPKGTVTVNVQAYMTGGFVYVAGAPGIQQATSGIMTFNDVADFGPGIVQPSVAIVVLDRTLGGPPFADVQPGQTVPGGNLVIDQYSSLRGWGAGKVSWKAGSAAIGYNMRDCSNINRIAAVPTYGIQGEALPVKADATPCSMTWNPTAAGTDEYLYYSTDLNGIEAAGIFLSTVNDASGGTKLVGFDEWSFNSVVDIEWLPDGSGFLYNEDYMAYDLGSGTPGTCGTELVGPCTNFFKYNLATDAITQLTDFPDQGAQYLSVSPDGQYAVFERTTGSVVDPTSELWILDLNTLQTHLLVQNAGRPSWGPTGAAPAAAPTVSTGLSRPNVVLSWTDNPVNVGGYRVWYSEKPDFQPDDADATSVNLPAGSTGWTHTGAASSAAHNYYYLAQGLGGTGDASGSSNRTGAFNLGLTPGTP